MTTESTPIIERLEGFTQVCVWPGITPGEATQEGMASYFLEEFDVRVQYLEEVTTLPDLTKLGNPIPETGGRNDILFAVHQDDVGKFAVPRFSIGVRWIEDVLATANHGRHMYDCERLDQYKTW